jgi:hypothetical protein
MHQAALQQAADFDATPKPGHGLALVGEGLEGLPGRLQGSGAVVVGDGQVAQAQGDGLPSQLVGPQAAVGIEGVAVEIELPRAAAGMDALENRR